MPVTLTDFVRHLSLPASVQTSRQAELERALNTAIARVESECGPLNSDTRPGRRVSLDSAVLILAQHIWETRRGNSPNPDMIPTDQSLQGERKESVPRVVQDLMSPWLLSPWSNL